MSSSKAVYCPVIGGCVRDPDGGRSVRCTHVKVWWGYDKGGVSLFTNKDSPSGYYLYVKPVSVSQGIESAPIFVGGKFLLEKCSRMGRVKSTIAQVMYEKMAKAIVIRLFGEGAAVLDSLPDPPEGKLVNEEEIE